MTAQTESPAAPLDEVMLAMDVVDTLRYRQDLVEREMDGDRRETRLIARLREVYLNQGIEVPERILKEGVAALDENRFVYTPPGPSLKRALAHFYVGRGQWGKWFIGISAALILAVGGYFWAYLPFQAEQREFSRIELAEILPEQMQTLYGVIFEETKVQSAIVVAQGILERGRVAASEGDRFAAQEAITRLTAIRDNLRLDYELRVVNRAGVRSGFWTFPEVNNSATNYYIVVEAIDREGQVLTLPIDNEETGVTESVALWGVRVPESVYEVVGADKNDDGIIQRNIVGQKQFGFLEVKYTVPVLGGLVTRW